MLILMVASFAIIGLWNIPAIKDSVHFVLDPTAGNLLKIDIYFGMFMLVFSITLLTTLAQKYLTDQETLRQIKKEQKEMQQEMKKYKHDPQKLLEFNKKQMEAMPKMFEITMRPLIYTFVPIVLFFRWFQDMFTSAEYVGFRFFGFLSWFWFYLIFAIIFSSILRKFLKVA